MTCCTHIREELTLILVFSFRVYTVRLPDLGAWGTITEAYLQRRHAEAEGRALRLLCVVSQCVYAPRDVLKPARDSAMILMMPMKHFP